MSEKRGCFKKGCLGCLGVVLIGGVVMGLLFGISLLQLNNPEDRQEPRVTHERPKSVPFLPVESDAVVAPLDRNQLGRVVLDVTMSSFRIEPAPAGDELRLEASYNRGAYRLSEKYEARGESGWEYRLKFDSRALLPITTEDPSNELTLYIPADMPAVLEGKIDARLADPDLGGLWVQEVDLDVGVGEHRVAFSKPTAVPMQKFSLHGSTGETSVRSLGNASPQEVKVRHSIGELFVDLDGAWKNDSDVVVASSIGECRIGMPEESIRLDVASASTMIGDSAMSALRRREAPPEGAPTVKVRAKLTIGEVVFAR